MHGRKKRVEPLSKEEETVLATKAKTYKSLMQIIQTRRKSKDYSAETFVLLSKLWIIFSCLDNIYVVQHLIDLAVYIYHGILHVYVFYSLCIFTAGPELSS